MASPVRINPVPKSFLFERSNAAAFAYRFSVWVLILSITGCAHHYVPDASTFALDSIPEFTSRNTVSLENSQTASEEVLFATNMGHKFYGSLRSWTDTAMEITQRELAKRDMRLATDAPKSLKLSIEEIKGTFDFWTIRCETRLRVETGDGYVNTYFGDNRSPATLYRAADGSVMRAVAEMLRDRKIVEYLKN